MKKLLFIFVLFPFLSFSQNQRALRLSYYVQPVEIDFQRDNSDIDGHKYFPNYWSSGTVIVKKTINLVQKKMIYDLVSEELIIGEDGNSETYVVADKAVTGFIIDNNRFVFMDKENFSNPTIEGSYFLTYEFSEHPNLIVKIKKTLKETPVSNGYNNSSGHRKYMQTSEYYILGKENKYTKTRLTKKNIIKILSDKESKVKKYIKENKLSLKKEKDVIKLLSFYHSPS